MDDAEPVEPAPAQCAGDPQCPREIVAGREVCWWHDVAVTPSTVEAAKLRGAYGGFRPPGW